MKNVLKKLDYLLLSIALSLKTWILFLVAGAAIVWFVKSNAALLIFIGVVSFISGRVFQRKVDRFSILFNFLSLFNCVMGTILFIWNIPVNFIFICPALIGFFISDNTTFEEAKRELKNYKSQIV